MSLINQNQAPEKPYEYQEYPKWVVDRIVQNADEEANLLGVDTASDREALMAAATAKGIKFGKNWSDDKIRAALGAA